MTTTHYLSVGDSPTEKNNFLTKKWHSTQSAFLLLLFLSVFSGYSFSQSTSTDATTNTVYRFEISEVTSPEDAQSVMASILSNEQITSCKFIDECDCFKITAPENFKYETLEEIIRQEGMKLSDKLVASDGRVIVKAAIINENGNHEE